MVLIQDIFYYGVKMFCIKVLHKADFIMTNFAWVSNVAHGRLVTSMAENFSRWLGGGPRYNCVCLSFEPIHL